MGCNCKKKNNEPVVQKYYVPATETEPAKIIETDKPISGLTNNDIDWFNNIDTINPIDNEY
jgi:hypothetical protein